MEEPVSVKKVLLVGNFGVGKTSLISRYVLNQFSEDYISSIGVKVSSKTIQLENQVLKLLIWDIAGTKSNEKVPKAYFLGASAAMFVFDLSREDTYLSIKNDIAIIKDLSSLDNLIVIGNKVDLLSAEELEKTKQLLDINIDFLTSAKEGENVEEAFKKLAKSSLN